MSPFSKRALWAIVGIGLGTFLFGLLLRTFGGQVFGEHSAGHDSYSRSLVGHQALVEFLSQSGLAVLIGRNPSLYRTREAFPLLLIEPIPSEKARPALISAPKETSDAENALDIRELLRPDQGEPGRVVVLVLPKWQAVPSFEDPRWIEDQRLLPLSKVRLVARLALPDLEEDAERVLRTGAASDCQAQPLSLPDLQVALKQEPQLLAPRPALRPLASCSQGILIAQVLEGGKATNLFIVSDPDLLNNRGLGLGDHAALIHGLLVGRLSAEGVLVDETLHGYSISKSITARAFSFPFVLLLLHGTLTLALLLWAMSTRFGKSLPPPPELPPGKTLLIQNTAALLLSAGHHADTLQRYLNAAMSQVALRFSLPEGTSRPDLLPRLEQLGRARGVETDLPALAEAVGKRPLSPAEVLRLAQRIHGWQRAMLGVED